MPSDGRAIVHVGTHKTGSTAFQNYLREWHTELLLDHRVLVHPGGALSSHLELAALIIRASLETPDRFLLKDRRYFMTEEDMRHAIRRTVDSDVDSVVFSSEGLCYMRTDEEVDALRDLLSPRSIQPVVALRRPEDYLRSYASTLKLIGFSTPSNSSTPSEPTSTRNTAPDSWLVDYEALVDVLHRVADGGAVHVVDYDLEARGGGSIIPALARSLGLDRGDLYPGWDRRDNESRR